MRTVYVEGAATHDGPEPRTPGLMRESVQQDQFHRASTRGNALVRRPGWLAGAGGPCSKWIAVMIGIALLTRWNAALCPEPCVGVHRGNGEPLTGVHAG